MLKTEHFNLNRPEAADPIRVDDFNENAEIIDAALGSLVENVGSGGSNCRVCTGTYTGDGKYGSSNKSKLSFPFRPIWVMIAECGKTLNTSPESMSTCTFLRPLQGASSTNGKALQVSWGSTSVSWYCDENETNPQTSQNNKADYLYYWIALCAAE